ncbi:unnamed protein product [Calypogeia fissa]
MAMAGRAMLRAGQRQVWPSNRSLVALLQHERWVAQSTKVLSKDSAVVLGPSHEGDVRRGATVVYEGAFSDTLRRVKLLSLTTCCLSIAGGPIITFFTSPDLPVILKGALASTMVCLSASTTGALHWFAGPYVHKLTWNPGDKEVEVEVLSWFATRIKKKFKLSDIRTPYTNRPLVTFSANNEYYFIDKDNFPNQELLDKLLPERRDRVA